MAAITVRLNNFEEITLYGVEDKTNDRTIAKDISKKTLFLYKVAS